MKTIYKICLLNIGLALLFGALATYATGSPQQLTDFIGFFGLGSLLGSAACIVIGLLLLLLKRKIWGQGCLLSAGILLLLGFALCSTFALR